MEKHFFLGSNTPNGFYGHFDDLLDISKVIILKGGAGTGKSTLMKKIGDFARSAGLNIEYYHCSSDISSLDGIFIPSLEWSILDGTSPHIVEATIPAVNQFIFNLSDGVDTAKITKFSNTIENHIKCKKTYFNNAFYYLKSAYYINKLIQTTLFSNCNIDYLNTLSNDIFKHLESYECPLSRTLFIKAITPQGVVSFADNCFSHTNNIFLKTDYPELSNYIITKIKQKCLAHNIKHIDYLSPFDTSFSNALQIGNYAITSDKKASQNYLVYNLDSSINNNIANLIADDLSLFNNLFDNAIAQLNKALNTHIEVEKFYINALDFKDINAKTQHIHNIIFNNFN